MGLKSFGQNINQLGASGYARGTTETPEFYFQGIVEDVVTNEEGGKILPYKEDGSNLGEIIFRAIPDDRYVPVKKLRKALPMGLAFTEFPLVGELVLVYKTAGQLLYTSRINVSQQLAGGVWKSLQEQVSPTDVKLAAEQRELARLGAGVPAVEPRTAAPVTETTTPPKYLRLNSGDTVIQSRYGSSIRLGTNRFKNPTTTTPEPNILFTAGQWKNPTEVSTKKLTVFSSYYENINHDKNSIWMVVDQEVPFVAATALSKSTRKAHLLSSPNKTSTYDGAQIFINSDRVILNSKKNEISLFSNTEINLSSMQAITMDTETSVFLRANNNISIKADGVISLDANAISITSAGDLSYKTPGNYSITGGKIFIGRYGDTSQPMVLGATLSQWLNVFLTQILKPGAMVTGTGPVILRPDVLRKLTALKLELGSTPQSSVFNSRSNYTSKTNSV